MPLGTYTSMPTTPVLHKSHCCALAEIDYLSLAATPQDAFRALGPLLWSKRGLVNEASFYGANFVVFSGAISRHTGPQGHSRIPQTNYAEAFADYITAHKLGVLVVSEPKKNPSTDNTVKVWLWSVDPTALFDHLHATGLFTPPNVSRFKVPQE